MCYDTSSSPMRWVTKTLYPSAPAPALLSNVGTHCGPPLDLADKSCALASCRYDISRTSLEIGQRRWVTLRSQGHRSLFHSAWSLWRAVSGRETFLRDCTLEWPTTERERPRLAVPSDKLSADDSMSRLGRRCTATPPRPQSLPLWQNTLQAALPRLRPC